MKLIFVVYTVFARESKTCCVYCISGNILWFISPKQTDHIQWTIIIIQFYHKNQVYR